MLQIINLIAFLSVIAYASYLFCSVLYKRYLYVKLGQKTDFSHMNIKLAITNTLINVFGQTKLLKDTKSGIMHVIMFYGFIIIQFGALDLILKGLFPGTRLPIPAYSYFLFLQEITTFLVLLATSYAYYRRYIEKLPRLKRGFKSGLVIIFLSTLMLSVLLSATFEKLMEGKPFTWYTPISSVLSLLFVHWITPAVSNILFMFFWWLHTIVLCSFMVYVPQSKHFHLLVAPLNIFLKRQTSPSKLELIDFEDESVEEYGVNTINQFQEKQLIDLYACVECGRCTNMCPASGTGKMLSPMDLIVKLRNHLTLKGASVTSKSAWAPAFALGGAVEKDINPEIIGNVITEQEIWACTTCRNCEDQCPVMNEHVDKIIDMRRHLVMTQGKMHAEATRTFNNIERQSNPWGINKQDRINWREDTNIPVPLVTDNPEFEYLLFVGSMGSYDNRSQKIIKALVKILHHAKVNFAILGNNEKNSGDTPRRMGNEFLFQQLAMENIEQFEKHKVHKIITIDPHAFNTFKNEYPDLGLNAKIYHHTEILATLLREKRIVPTKVLSEKITYHDSCYLGRYNNIYDDPRYILNSIPGLELVEMKRNKENGMCCGAGGGMMWLEETEGTRVNLARTEQALEVSPSIIGSACPYCLTMLSDGTKAKEVEDKVKTLDIVEILSLSLAIE